MSFRGSPEQFGSMPKGMGLRATLGKNAGTLGENANLLSDNVNEISHLMKAAATLRMAAGCAGTGCQTGAFGSASKSAAEWRSGSCSQGSPQLRLTLRPRITAGRASMRFAHSMTLR